MMLSLFLSDADTTSVILDFDLFLAEQAKLHRVSQPAIIAALRPRIIRPQSASPPVPAAQTGEECSPSLSSSSVDLTGLAAHERGPTEPQPPVAPDQCAEANAVVQTVTAHEPVVTSPAESEAVAISAPSRAQQLRALFADGKHPTAAEAVDALGYSSVGAARQMAGRLGLQFRQLTREERSEASRAGQLRHREEVKAKQAEATAKLKAEPQHPAVEFAAGGKPTSIRAKVKALHYEHPEWTAREIADHLGLKHGSIATALHDARNARRAELEAIQPAPKPTPQTPVAPAPPRTDGTLTERIRKMHQQHPTWTARMIANELGANEYSVSALLASVRGEAKPKQDAPAELTTLTGQQKHYSEVAKRLGKVSA